jgi:CubicO group peptidase (beta-lactamase class C family)
MNIVKILVKILIGLVLFVGLLAGIAYTTGNQYLVKGVSLTYMKGQNTANIYDGKSFDTRLITASPKPYEILAGTGIAIPEALEKEFAETQTASTMLIQNDKVLWEKYYNEQTAQTQGNSFSAVKTMVCFLVQIAIQEGKIPSWDAKAKDYLPWLTGKYADDVNLYHLASMSSGLDWQEAYTNPFCITAKAYYGNDVIELMKGLPIIDQPGKEFIYQSGNTQLLGIILSQAYGQPLSQIMEQKLWHPIGAESDATWSTDHKNGMELSYCCLNAITRDFAKMGLLTLHNGSLNGKQILDSTFLQRATSGQLSAEYGIGFWLGEIDGVKYQLFQGHLGQFIAVIPSKNVVFVRTGHQIKKSGHIPNCIQSYLKQVIKALP